MKGTLITKVGVIGVGQMGQHHARIYGQMRNVKLVGVSDIDADRGREIARRQVTEFYPSQHSLLENVDAVSIAVPTSLHKSVALDAIDRDVHVLVEKPIADTVESGLALVNHPKVLLRQVKMLVGHVERFNPAVQKLKELIDSGRIGKVVSISTRRVGGPVGRMTDVGVITDLAVHDIDIISQLYNSEAREREVFCVADPSKIESYASIMLEFKGKRVGLIDVNWLTPKKVRTLTAVGTGGVAYLDYIAQTLQIHHKGYSSEFMIERAEPLERELRHFIDIVQNKDLAPLVPPDQALYALKIAERALAFSTNPLR